jgi:fructose-1,6-bisphosphatase/inositol monophosphatase family enzyme
MASIPEPASVVSRLRELQRLIRGTVVRVHDRTDRAALSEVSRESSADTIYGIDAEVEPVIEEYCEHWGREVPLVVVAEGLEPESGRVFPHGARAEDAPIRIIMDPIDGTRGLMYDKRPAWCLAAAAPNKGPATRLSDVTVAVMTELPTSKMAFSDVLWAVKGRGAHAEREHLLTGRPTPLQIRPSSSDTLAHGFAAVANFFPSTKVLAAELTEFLIERIVGTADPSKSLVFEDQYISTGGQFYELMMGHDRFIADLRPYFYKIQKQAAGLCCHPYDCGGLLIAQEAGVHITDGLGNALDGPMDTTTGLSWAGFANSRLRARMEPLLTGFLRERGA